MCLCSSLSVRDSASRPCKITGKIVFLFILILVLLDIKREHKIFWTEWWQVLLELNLLLISPWVKPPRDLVQDEATEGNEDSHCHRLWKSKPLCVTTLYWTPSLSISMWRSLKFCGSENNSKGQTKCYILNVKSIFTDYAKYWWALRLYQLANCLK
jgi:hypothetical protein